MMSSETIDMDAKELWDRARTIYISTLQTPAEQSQANRYFSMVTTVSNEANVFTIFTSSAFAADLLTKDYADKLRSCFSLAGADKNLVLQFSFDASAKQSIVIPPTINYKIEKGANSIPKISTFISTMPLKEDYNFDEFVEGSSNSWALSAAKGAAKNPGKIKGYNPLFIHGGTGLGKTHLMQAIGNEIRRTRPELAVCYLTAETFLNEYISSLQEGALNTFRTKFRGIDVLLIDDIQFLQKSRQFQEEFFNTFNALQGADKQLVMTSDVSPKNLPMLDSRLISRFEGGMVQEIESPNYETRLAILKKKAETLEPKVPDSILEFLAENIKSHVRAMEGALAKVNVMMMTNPSMNFNNELLAHLLKDFIDKEIHIRKITVEEIQAVVAKKYQVTIGQILSSERTQSLVTPRQMAMYVARTISTNSLTEIARLFDKSHATILHGAKAIKKRLDVEDELKLTLKEILDELGYEEKGN